MPHLIAYGMINSTSNLVKAQCDICGRKYGSVEEAKKCEMSHFNGLGLMLSKALEGQK